MQQKSIFRNFIYKALLNCFNIIIPIFIGSYISKTLGSSGIGRVNYVDKIHQAFLIFASFGIYSYGLREISKVRDDKEKLKSTFSSLLLIGNISTILVFFIYLIFVFLNFKFDKDYLIFLIFSINIFSVLFNVEWANEALENYKFITAKTIAIKIIYIISLLLLIRKPDNYVAYSIILVLSTFINNIISYIYIVKDIGFTFKGVSFKKHLPYLLITLLISNGNYLYTQLDSLFLGNYINKTSVGMYTTAQNIVCMINALIMSVIFVTLPRLSSLICDNDTNGYKKLLNKSYNGLCIFLFPSAIGIYVLAQEILFIYGGIEFVPATNILRYFTIYMITTAIDAAIVYQIIYAKKQEKTLICFVLTCGLTNLVCKCLLLNYGLLTPCSAIITTILCNTLLIAIEYIYCSKYLKTKIQIFKLSNLKYLFIALFFIPIAYFIKLFTNSIISTTLITVITCSLFYFLVLLIIKDELVITVLNKILNKYISIIKKDKAL